MNSKFFQSGNFRYVHLVVIIIFCIASINFFSNQRTLPIFLSGYLLIHFFRVFFNYYSQINIISNELVFNQKIKIPLDQIKYVVLNYQDNWDLYPSYLFVTDQYGRTGKFYFTKNREEFNQLEDELIKNNVKIGIQHETNNTLKEAYSN